MGTIRRLAAVAVIIGVATSCAAKLPPADGFSPSAWARVEALTPGTRVEVRYVSTATGKPLRQHFEGKLLAATGDILEVETRHGVQRLLPGRVTRVAAGGKGSHLVPLTSVFAVLGVVLATTRAAINEDTDEVAASHAIVGGAIGAVAGLVAGARRGDARPVVVYSRSGSL